VKWKTVLLLIGLLQLSPSRVLAEAVTLREAISRALHSNHLLKAATLQQRAAEEGISISRSRYLPRVQLESGAVISNTPSKVFMMKLDEGRINPDSDFAPDALNNPSPRGDFSTLLALQQPLFDLNILTGVEFAQKEAETAGLVLEARREQVAYGVYLAYLAVRRAQAARDIADQALANACEHARLAELREKEGLGLKSDRLRTQSALDEAEQRLITAKNDLLLAKMKLNLVVGGEQGGALDITEIPALGEPTLPEEALAALAQRNRTDLRAGRKEVEKGELAVKQSRNAWFPTLYGSATYQLNDRDLPLGRDNDSWSAGVNLRWELFDGARRTHEKRKAELSRRSAAEQLEHQRREVALQVTESVLRREEAGLKLQTAGAAVQAAEEARRLVSLRFRNGLSTMADLMDAEGALNRARVNKVEVENAYEGATAEVYYRSGVFLQEVMR
jgi:outer membrane protein